MNPTKLKACDVRRTPLPNRPRVGKRGRNIVKYLECLLASVAVRIESLKIRFHSEDLPSCFSVGSLHGLSLFRPLSVMKGIRSWQGSGWPFVRFALCLVLEQRHAPRQDFA